MTDIELFIREAASPRGIDGDTAVAVAMSEGGVTEYCAVGTFPTGSSFWSFQLHYGGPSYPQYGVPGQSVMGMGGAFTELTGWQPEVEAAWRDAIRYALNRAREGGWGAWYGAAAAGIGDWDGIDTSVPWDPNSETWDYEMTTPAPLPSYDCLYPSFAQNDDWSCAPTSMRWALWSYQREPTESWLEGSMLAEGVVSTSLGLLNASGVDLAAWASRHYGENGYVGESDGSVTFAEVAEEAQTSLHPLMIGGRAWGAGGHWSGVRGFDGQRLLLANPAPGYGGVTQHMSKEQFGWLGPFSMVRLRHPEAEGQPRPPVPPTEDPYAPWRSGVGSGLLELMAQDGTLPAQRASTWLPLGAPSPADIEECYGANGVRYTWLLTVGKGYRYPPA
ncbi:MAG TPA: hypothetical protein VIL10_05310 [Marmoricola sp.]